MGPERTSRERGSLLGTCLLLHPSSGLGDHAPSPGPLPAPERDPRVVSRTPSGRCESSRSRCPSGRTLLRLPSFQVREKTRFSELLRRFHSLPLGGGMCIPIKGTRKDGFFLVRNVKETYSYPIQFSPAKIEIVS